MLVHKGLNLHLFGFPANWDEWIQKFILKKDIYFYRYIDWTKILPKFGCLVSFHRYYDSPYGPS